MTSSAHARLSVCIPTWNGAETIERALASLLAQDMVELEIVVSDDASTDDTLARILAVEDPRIRVVDHAERAGIVGNWNRALREARAPCVALFGQDDEVDPDWASTMLAMLDAHPDAAMAFCRRRFVYDSPEAEEQLSDFFSVRYRAWLDAFYAGISERVETETMVRAAMVHDFEINLIGEPAFVIYRHDHASIRGGYDPRMNQMIDWEFCLRMVASGPILHCARELGSFHLRASGTSADNAKSIERHYREYDYLLDLVRARFARWLSDDDERRLRERQEAARKARP